MNQAKMNFLETLRYFARIFESYADLSEPLLFLCELPPHLRDRFDELDHVRFRCRYCRKVFPGVGVESLEHEYFVCWSCYDKLHQTWNLRGR